MTRPERREPASAWRSSKGWSRRTPARWFSRTRRGAAARPSGSRFPSRPSPDQLVTTIRVVEDDPALRNAVRSSRTAAGHEIGTAGDGAAGVRELETHEFDIVLLDIGLPFVDGWKILTGIQGRRVPSVIVISARGEERDKVRALDLGADDYLAKPFGADELLARIRA